MSLVVDAPGERLEVQGFRFGDAEGDEDIWRRVWQANDLDAGSQLAHTEALMKGVAYALVEPQADGVPVVTIEDALDCVVEVAPKDRRERVAALKRWVDDEGHLVAYVHLPDAVYKYRSLGKAAPVVTSDLPDRASWRWRPRRCAGPGSRCPTSPGRCPTRSGSCRSCRCRTGRASRVAPGR